jgi:hypothetical protein
MMNRLVRCVLVLAALLVVPLRGYATDLTVDNGWLGASVTFSASGSNLLVTLTNNFPGDPSKNKDILTGVFFDIDPSVGDLTTISARLGAGSSVTNGGGTDPGGSVGGEWAYQWGSNTILFGDHYGLSAVSGGIFDKADLFGGTNLSGASGPDGVDYGITSKTDTAGNNDATLAGIPLILNQVVFTLGGLPAGFDPSSAVSNINFAYGPKPSNVPEPTSLALLGIGSATAWVIRRRRKVNG